MPLLEKVASKICLLLLYISVLTPLFLKVEMATQQDLTDILVATSYLSPIGSGKLSDISAEGQAYLKNKTLDDETVVYVDDGDITKKMAFQLSGITTGTTRTYAAPNKDGTLALLDDVAGASTFRNLTDTNLSVSITNKSGLYYDTATSEWKDTSAIELDGTQLLLKGTSTQFRDASNTYQILMDTTTGADNFCLLSAPQTVQSKTLDSSNTFNDGTDTYSIVTPSIFSANDTFAVVNWQQTLDNKTLTSNTIYKDGSNTYQMFQPSLLGDDTLLTGTSTLTVSNKTLDASNGMLDKNNTYLIKTPVTSAADLFVTELAANIISNKTISYSSNTLTGVQPTVIVEYAESEALSTTTSATFVQKLRLTTTSLAVGTYYLSWYCEICNTNNDKEMTAQIEQDDTTVLGLCRNSSKRVSNDTFHTFSGIKQLSGLSGVHTFDLDFLANSDTAQIQRARIKISSV